MMSASPYRVPAAVAQNTRVRSRNELLEPLVLVHGKVARNARARPHRTASLEPIFDSPEWWERQTRKEAWAWIGEIVLKALFSLSWL
jgi:hypothetical protein